MYAWLARSLVVGLDLALTAVFTDAYGVGQYLPGVLEGAAIKLGHPQAHLPRHQPRLAYV